MTRTILAALLAGTTLASPAIAHDTAEPRKTEFFQPGVTHAATAADEAAPGAPVLYEGLGNVAMPITTTSPEAQAHFDQGLRLAWAFNHAEAARSFRHAQILDPACAMCFWGEAFVLGPNINDGMSNDRVQPAWDAISRARSLAAHASAKEQALIAALAARYGANPMASRAQLDLAWAEAIRAVATDYPQDAVVQTLKAEALMNLQPWDYWEADGVTAKGNAAEIVEALETALAIDPSNEAAAHLFIHAVEASATPERAEAVADRLRGTTPGAGHLAHMPAHIYMRIGRHADSIAANREAIAADEAFLAQAGAAASPLYRFGYYPHNVHFLAVSAQSSGLGAEALAAADKLVAVTSDEVSAERAWVQAIRTAPLTAHAQFSDLETVLALPEPDGFPFVKGYWHYARGVALAIGGDAASAETEAAAIERLIAHADFSGLDAQYLPAGDVLGIALGVLRGRIAWASGDLSAAEEHLHAAAALEAGMPYMEPPYWYYPVQQTLGAVLLAQGRADEAAEAFSAALKTAPRNGWALWGLAEAQDALGDPAAAATRASFERVWLGDPGLLTLERL